MKVIIAKDSAFILLQLRRNSPGFTVRETTLKDGDFLLRPSQSYKLIPFQQSGKPGSPIYFPILCYRLAAQDEGRQPERTLRQNDHGGGECYLALSGERGERHEEQESVEGEGENE